MADGMDESNLLKLPLLSRPKPLPLNQTSTKSG